jgi:hypothetical protein
MRSHRCSPHAQTAVCAHLAALGAPEPNLPPFDESQHEPMPEVEIDPEDEFHVGEVGG